MTEKLQKVLANQGLGSRREMEKWIEQGRVSVDGHIATLGDRVDNSAQIRVDGHLLSRQVEKSVCRVLMYNKPEGELCARKDPEGRATVFDRLPAIRNGRWIAVGRLDVNTSGLLLFTNDGELANRLMHPKCEVEREYAVRVFGEVPNQTLNILKKGVKLDDGEARFTSIKPRTKDDESMNQWFNVTLAEGRNREVRRLWESQNLQVSRLLRVRYGPIELQKRLPLGAWVELPLEQVNELRKLVQLPDESDSMVDSRQNKLDHTRLSRMRRSVKKHRARSDSRHDTRQETPVSPRPKTRRG
ncbi:23S rRNA pseudouridine(2605) synthase RluB [Alteromonas aestuariivivens]|uniref:Pseudouridine synthase n=1 Tax=Alteromonas aestuariivivens TaxID=1938339 RepID=A0A3D8M3M1_9ALTE|nr:23S rRNA pseudouridine(2605) synthase RluB [Alteromonas aestuariivivens]RDV24289.1 23S rRNA pseudouridine(2605) synthase RluB [Alteromonas aestuariivivens]